MGGLGATVVPPARATPRGVEYHGELHRRFVSLANDARDAAAHHAEDSDDPSVRRAARGLLKLIEDPERDWPVRVRADGMASLPEFQAPIAKWRQEDVDWRQMAYWPAGWSARGGATISIEPMRLRRRRGCRSAFGTEARRPNATDRVSITIRSIEATSSAVTR